MPLLDDFHPLLPGRRHWEGFRGSWAAMAGKLNENLPPASVAEFPTTVSTRVESEATGVFAEKV